MIVIRPGMLTTVQDGGRWGYQHEGVPVAGPMDPWSHARANRLAGNDASAATLEITLMGPRLRAETPARVVLCGGRFAVRVNGDPVDASGPIDLKAGDEIDVAGCTSGARGYLACTGGFDVPPILGSRATHLPSAMGGMDGRALRAGDRLAVGALLASEPARVEPSPQAPMGSADAVVRVVRGPDVDEALERGFEGLLASRFEIAPESNRMGYRLRGAELPVPDADRLSTATPMGTVQVPSGGAPILLMADRQTTGGYPRVATVISADLGIAGQLKPGDGLRFVACSQAEALDALRARLAEIDA